MAHEETTLWPDCIGWAANKRINWRGPYPFIRLLSVAAHPCFCVPKAGVLYALESLTALNSTEVTERGALLSGISALSGISGSICPAVVNSAKGDGDEREEAKEWLSGQAGEACWPL